MNERTARLRQASLDAIPTVSGERAALMTEFYRENLGRWSAPVLRARAFLDLCERKTVWIGDGELIVGERGPAPKAVPTFPELTCHSVDDLGILDSRPKTSYRIPPECVELYEKTVIPFWRGRSLRDRIFAAMPPAWRAAYDAGVFTEFMEQRAPGHTVLDDKIYSKGMLAFKEEIARSLAALDFVRDPDAYAKREELIAMRIACDAAIVLAERYAALAERMAEEAPGDARRRELARVAEVCRRVPAHAPRDFHEALQAYWFCHLGVITELNGWDAFNPGHLDQHLLLFYRRGLADGTLTEASARELLECFFVKFNNHPAPPKVGVTAAESGTYTDFANINLGGLLGDGGDGSNEVTHLLLDIVDEMHLLQPSSNLQLSRATPDDVLAHALRVVREGYGFPSLFNADVVVKEQLRQGKSVEDARAGGCSGCVEVGAFGKEAYILTGYFNLPKVLELALHDGVDPRTGARLGPATGAPATLATFDALFAAFERQLRHLVDVKIAGNRLIERLYAEEMPAPFLSVLIDDCIAKGRDYNAGGARYNNTFIQAIGIGTITDSLAAVRRLVYEDKGLALPELVSSLDSDFADDQPLRSRLVNRMPKYGNDDDLADELMVRVFEAAFACIDGRPTANGGTYRIEMLPTTCHVYFGSVCGATPDGRRAGMPLSEGISPVQGADRRGPTAVFASAAKMDHVRTGGTLLNMKFTPEILASEEGIRRLAHLVRGYFGAGGHHVQFNVVSAETLRKAKVDPEAHRGLIVRVAGYSDYFCDLGESLQDEIIARTEHGST
ncbi:MAG TPA: trans-4-hydroxy-L-proline dehydratase [Thermoanaerobaculaceae bacterium]|nr:trans-4-hydroxy-L-proline dehydratase [Thermoanaerobaculaceae bacterium]